MVRKIKFKLFALLSILTLGISLVSMMPKSLAAGGTIFFSPSSLSETSGSIFTVDVDVNPGTSINAVQVDVSYDSSLLQYDSSTPITFTLCAQNSGGGGSVSMGCAGSATSSQIEVAAITFTALAGSGSTSLSLSGSYAANGGSSVSLSPSDASVSFTTPSSQSGSGSGSGGSKTSSTHTATTKAAATTASSGGTTTASPAATTSPSVSLPKVSINSISVKPNLTSASVTVNSSSNITSVVNYGGVPSSLVQSITSSTNNKTNVINLPNLTPASTYYYQVIDEYNGSPVSTSTIKLFETSGFTLSVTVLDSHYAPLAGQVVYLHSNPIKAVTNSKGIATFYNVPSGVHHLDYTSGGKSYSEVVYVSDTVVVKGSSVSAPTQSQSVILSGYVNRSSGSLKAVLLTLILIVILLFALMSVVGSRHKDNLKSGVNKFLGNIKPKE